MTDRDRLALPAIMKYAISIVILFFGVSGMAAMVALAPKPETTDGGDKLERPLVATFDAAEFDGDLNMDVSGRVVPYREIRIPVQVTGTIEKKSECFQAGRFVTPDDVLLIIDDTDYKITKTRLEAELQQSVGMLSELKEDIAGAERTIKLANDELSLAESERDRKRRIRNSISQTELQNAERNWINARKALQTAENSLSKLQTSRTRLEKGKEVVQANLDKAIKDLERCTIRPPSKGVIVSEAVEQGEIVQAGTVVAVFEDTSKVEVECNLRVDQLNWLLENIGLDADDPAAAYSLPPTDVEITSSIGRELVQWDGVLSRIDGIGLDEQTKTVPCRIDVANPIAKTSNGIRPLVRNMYVKVKIKIPSEIAGEKRKFVRFPAVAVQPGSYIWTVVDGKLKKCDVKVVEQQPADEETSTPAMVVVLVDDQIHVGDKIVTSPLSQPTDGAAVREKTNS